MWSIASNESERSEYNGELNIHFHEKLYKHEALTHWTLILTIYFNAKLLIFWDLWIKEKAYTFSAIGF